MGSNPMQKMKRNSILIGLIVGLVIGLIMCVAVYFFLNKNGGAISTGNGETVSVCVLNKNINSGAKITEADFITKTVSKDNVPTNATTQVINGVAKIDLSKGTILTSSMLNAGSTEITADLREQEYNMITLPSQLAVGDFIDIRLQLPNGGDYVVISKKQVLKCDSSTIWLNMYEEEIELLGNAIIEYYIMTGSKLYATTYVEPGLQTAAVGTYVPNSTVASLISANPNIKNVINSERYSDALKAIRNNNIKSEVDKYSDTALENIETNMQEEIKTLKESREAYFGVLNSAN